MAAQRTSAAKRDATALVAAEFYYGKQQRKTGLPGPPSVLTLDQQRLDAHGLLHPGGVLERVETSRRKRSSEVQVAADLVAARERAPDDPHYMALTRSFEMHGASLPPNIVATVRGVREMRDAARASARGGMVDASRTTEDEAAEARRRPTAAHKMSAQKLALELKEVERAQAPLNFMRNPRYAPRSSLPPTNTTIQPVPDEVCFTEYHAGGVYEMDLQLRNDSRLLRRVRLLPPSSPYFAVSLLSYVSDDSGDIAPGMYAKVRVRFLPDSLADYNDHLIVVTESGNFEVPLKARRPPPMLTLAPELDCGYSYVGSSLSTSFEACNQGGAGRFLLFDAAAWEAGEREPPATVEAAVRVGNFAVSPTSFEVAAGGTLALDVVFTPEASGLLEARVVLVCDNCQTREIMLVAHGCVPSVRLESVAGRAPLYEGFGGTASLQDEIDFGAVSVYGESSVHVRLLNAAPLPLDVEWVARQVPLNLRSGGRHRAMAPSVLRSDLLGPIIAEDAEKEAGFPFFIEPREAQLAPGEAADFVVRFMPTECTEVTGALMLAPLGVHHAALVAGLAEVMAAGGHGASAAAAVDDDAETAEVALRLQGIGIGANLELRPAMLVGAVGALDEPCHLAVTLHNPNSSARRWRCVHSSDANDALRIVALHPEAGELSGGASVDIGLILRGEAPGPQQLQLAFEVEPHGGALTLPVSVLVTPPRLTLSAVGCDGAEVDFGLVPLGESREHSIRLENPTGAPASWVLLPDSALADGADSTISWGWSRGGCSAKARSELDRVESRSRDAFAPLGLELSAHCGVLPPYSSEGVSVVFEPSEATPFRARIAARVHHGEASMINCRAEVVRRAACVEGIEASTLNFGRCFITVAASGMFTLRNLTRLPTRFEIAPPVAETMLAGRAQVQLDPSEGTLEPNGSVEVAVTLESAAPGELSALLGCHIQGGEPVAVRLAAHVEGIRLSYELFDEKDERVTAPPPMAMPHPPPTNAGVPPSECAFGDRVPIFSEVSRVLLIRNHSAVRTPFSVRPLFYTSPPLGVADELPPDVETVPAAAALAKSMAIAERRVVRVSASRSSLRSRGTTRDGDDRGSVVSYARSARSMPHSCASHPSTSATVLLSAERMAACRPRLSGANEKAQPFLSESGINYAARQALRRREAALLSGGCIGAGAAFEAQPESGELEPWSQVLVRVTAHSNMFGSYSDSLDVVVEGAAAVRIPMTLGVVGSSVCLDDATVGLSFRTDPPMLQWAPVPLNSAVASKKSVRLTNRGPLPLTVECECSSSGGGGEDAATATEPCPFTVTPSVTTLFPNVEQIFNVTFASNSEGHHCSQLVARPRHPFPVPLPGGGAGADHPPLVLKLDADVLAPRLNFSETDELCFRVSSTHSAEHSSFSRTLVLSNPLPMPLSFSLEVAPPFVLLRTANSAAGGRSSAGGGGMLHLLPPQESVAATIGFIRPGRRKRPPAAEDVATDADDVDDAKSVVSLATSNASTSIVAAKAPTSTTAAMLQSQQKFTGLLKVSFAGGGGHDFPLVAHLSLPYLQLEPSVVDFGVVHIRRTKEIEIQLYNPSESEAKWSISHLKSSPTDEEEEFDDKALDEPNVFSLGDASGCIPPRLGARPKPRPLLLGFTPVGPGRFRSTFVVKVKHGLPTRLVATAVATLEEEHDEMNPDERNVRLMVPGALL